LDSFAFAAATKIGQRQRLFGFDKCGLIKVLSKKDAMTKVKDKDK
jgi:hypothetical protein